MRKLGRGKARVFGVLSDFLGQMVLESFLMTNCGVVIEPSLDVFSSSAVRDVPVSLTWASLRAQVAWSVSSERLTLPLASCRLCPDKKRDLPGGGGSRLAS